MPREPLPRRAGNLSIASPRFLRNQSKPPKSANTANTIVICSVSSIACHLRFCLFHELVDSNGNGIVEHDDLSCRKFNTTCAQEERSTGWMIGSQHGTFLQVEDFSDGHHQVSNFEFYLEWEVFETL